MVESNFIDLFYSYISQKGGGLRC